MFPYLAQKCNDHTSQVDAANPPPQDPPAPAIRPAVTGQYAPAKRKRSEPYAAYGEGGEKGICAHHLINPTCVNNKNDARFYSGSGIRSDDCRGVVEIGIFCFYSDMSNESDYGEDFVYLSLLVILGLRVKGFSIMYLQKKSPFNVDKTRRVMFFSTHGYPYGN